MTENPKHVHLEDDVRLPRMLRWRLRVLRFIAVVFIVLEKSLEQFWPLILWSAAFCSVWLLQIPEIFGRQIEILAAVAFLAGFGIFFWRGVTRLRLPRRDDVTRRIEEDSDLLHRPLSGLDDRLANPDKENTSQLWNFWQARLLPALQHLRLPRSRPVLPQQDPYAFRGLVFIVLIAAVIMAGPSWPERIKHGVIPVLPSFAASKTDGIIMWITPPDYTGQSQIVMKGDGRNSQTLSVPEGSIIKARVKAWGWLGTPTLAFDTTELKMERLGKNSYGLEIPVQQAETVSVQQFLIPHATWHIAYGADLPPTVTQKSDIVIEAPKGEIKIPLTVQDDYSVESLTATIRLAPTVTAAPPFGDIITDHHDVMSAAQTPMDFTPRLNLAWHPWAGLDVVMDIEVRDHKGQTASLKGLQLKLPERQFTHPVARKLVELRKRLIWAPEAAAKNIAFDLENILVDLGAYRGDLRTFLSLRSMASHLFYDPRNTEVAKIIAQLWDTALRLEDGNFSMAQRTLQQAQKALQDALKNPNATPDEIAGLMDNLRQAMMAYMQEAFREMQKKMAASGKDMKMLSPEMFAGTINPQDLAAMLDRMQADALSGDRNAAREMLSQMERLMDMMDPSSMQAEMPQDMQAMMEGLEKLQELIDRQKILLDKTEQATAPDKALAEEQAALRQMLGEFSVMMAEKTGSIPEKMGLADEAMGKAHEFLEQHSYPMAVPPQEEALRQLSQSQEQMSEQLAQRMKQMMMMSFGMGPTDPLGRPMKEGENGAPGEGSKVKIPEEAERKRIHDILEDLRKKSGELQRPDYELEYYRRLMRQF